MEEAIARVVAVLDTVAGRWVLVGAHAVGMLTEPRATVDFDFVVEAGKLKRVVASLQESLGPLDVVDMGPALRLRSAEGSVPDLDLIRSSTHSLFGEALEHVREVEGWKVPAPEVLIVLKFLSAVSPWRGPAKRTYDVGDLRALYEAVGKEGLDAALMSRLAAQVYPGAEQEFESLLGAIERGEPISI